MVGRQLGACLEAMPPSPVTCLFFFFLTMQVGGERGKGYCEISMGWGACVCISLNFPRNEVSLFSVQNHEGWERTGCKKPGTEGSPVTAAPSLALNPSNIARISQTVTVGTPPGKDPAGLWAGWD